MSTPEPYAGAIDKSKGSTKAPAARKTAPKSTRKNIPTEKSKKPLPTGASKLKPEEVQKSLVNKAHPFPLGEMIIHPARGVGMVARYEDTLVANENLEVVVISFPDSKTVLQVPLSKMDSVGLRKVVPKSAVSRVISILKGRARPRRGLWSKRALQYEAEIKIGDPMQLAQIVRDLYRGPNQAEQSYSERRIFERALDRLSAELAVVYSVDRIESKNRLLLNMLGG